MARYCHDRVPWKGVQLLALTPFYFVCARFRARRWDRDVASVPHPLPCAARSRALFAAASPLAAGTQRRV